MLVEVTQENINQGVNFSTNSCPVALAMQENGFENVRVNILYISYDYQPTPLQLHNEVCLHIDSPLSQWIQVFDDVGEVLPIQIDINEEALYVTLVE